MNSTNPTPNRAAPVLADLLARYLGSRVNAPAADGPDAEIEPYEVASGLRGDPRAAWTDLCSSQLEPSAVDLLQGRLAMLFEGPSAAVEAQAAACPGERADEAVWAESARVQAAAAGREPFGWQECVLARPGPGIAYVAAAPDRVWSPLAERIRASFDPDGILV